MKVAAVRLEIQLDGEPGETEADVKQFVDAIIRDRFHSDPENVLYTMIQPSTIGVEDGWEAAVLLALWRD